MPLCPLCAFSIITVPRQRQKFAFRDLNIEENFLFLKKKGACFTLKGHFLLLKKGNFRFRKKGTFWMLEILGASVPPPPPFRRPCPNGKFGVKLPVGHELSDWY